MISGSLLGFFFGTGRRVWDSESRIEYIFADYFFRRPWAWSKFENTWFFFWIRSSTFHVEITNQLLYMVGSSDSLLISTFEPTSQPALCYPLNTAVVEGIEWLRREINDSKITPYLINRFHAVHQTVTVLIVLIVQGFPLLLCSLTCRREKIITVFGASWCSHSTWELHIVVYPIGRNPLRNFVFQ